MPYDQISREKSYIRKAQELVITGMLEFWMNKEHIFEIYMNSVEWGNGVYGAEAAAQQFDFGIETDRVAKRASSRSCCCVRSISTTIAIRRICRSARVLLRVEWALLNCLNDL